MLSCPQRWAYVVCQALDLITLIYLRIRPSWPWWPLLNTQQKQADDQFLEKTTQNPGWRCLQFSTITHDRCPDVALVITWEGSLAFKMHPTAWLPWGRSGKRKWLGPQWTSGHLWSWSESWCTGAHCPRASKAKGSEATSRELWHHVLCMHFLFLLSTGKWERGMWIEPLKDRLLSAFFPGGHKMERRRDVFLCWGQGPGWLATRRHLKNDCSSLGSEWC